VTAVAERLSAALADRYRIERELGAGGMATVYLAQDLKHDRRVALKVLKPELAAVLGAERFVVEIKTTAALQHPHILPLFDSGTADGFLYYVMPYIQGETLRSKLDRETQLGIDESVRITCEVADALDYAHRHGVIHRDIKPENILLHDGRPMVADFGIALAVSAAAGGRMTETGLSLGTPHYMSPEQATAEKELTNRSDIYSLGCVLYEMLTGSPPHVGASAQQIVMKIVMDEARPVTQLRKSVPANVAAATAKALEKLPADRFESARAFAEALTNPAFTTTGLSTTRPGSSVRDWRQRLAVPALVAAVLLAAALLWALTRPAPAPTVARYLVELAEGQDLSGTPWSRLAVSPDGSRLVYVGDAERGTRLFVRTRDQLKATAIPGTEGAINPAFSPDGDRIAFMDRVAEGHIKVVSLAGGPAVAITDSAVGAPGLTWGHDGFIYYDVIGIGPLMRVRETGGAAASVGRLDSTRGELQHAWPDALPNGKGLIMTVSHGGPGAGGSEADEIAVLDLATGTHRVLVRGVFARYVRSGHLAYVTADGALMGVPFDQDRMELTGEAVALTEGVGVRVGSGAVDLAVSAGGTLWYAAGAVGSAGTQEVVWVGRDGSATPVAAGWAGLIANPVLSPDGKRLAVSTRELVSQVWIKELDHGPLSKLTVDGSNNVRPAWSADGRSVAFVSNGSPNRDLYQRLADGSRPATLLLDAERPVEEAVFSRDGAWLIYRTGSFVAEGDLYARRLGSDSSIVLVATPAYETSPSLSPDGRWLAYVSNESGTAEVYVRPFPNTADGRWQISVQGGQEPLWAHSGRELFYRTASGAVPQQMAMEIVPGRTFIPGERRTLFPLTRYVLGSSHQQYAVAPEDRRFVMIRATGSDRADKLVVVENFFEELRQKVGTGR
jgi:serine/threonine protein kinase/Tol biopolymer transport system component